MNDIDINTHLRYCINKNCIESNPQPLASFHLDNSRKDGLQVWCKTCSRIEGKLTYQKNRDKRIKQATDWRLNNMARCRENEKRQYWNNRQAILTARKAPASRQREHTQNWRLKNKDRIKETSRIWRKNNTDKVREQVHKYQSRKRNLPATLTNEEWKVILEYYEFSCAYCGISQEELPTALHREHVIPMVLGGGYTKENIVPSCVVCNSSKGPRPLESAAVKLRKPLPFK